jgi:hypothetical protein
MSNEIGSSLQVTGEKRGTSAWEMGYDDFDAGRW